MEPDASATENIFDAEFAHEDAGKVVSYVNIKENRSSSSKIHVASHHVLLGIAAACVVIIGLGSAQLWYVKDITTRVGAVTSGQPPGQGHDVSGQRSSAPSDSTDEVLTKHHVCCPLQFHEREMGKCYRVVPYLFNHTDAAGVCQLMYPGAHLIDVNSAHEQAYIAELADRHDLGLVWTSGIWTGPSLEDFVWGNSNAKFEYTNWWPEEPDEMGCVLIWASSYRTWNDMPCNDKFASICEYP